MKIDLRFAVVLSSGLAMASALFAVAQDGQAQTRGRQAAPRTARASEPVAARCTALLSLWVSDARDTLTQLGVTPAADFEAVYRRRVRNFDATCGALTPEQLSCLETAPNSIAAVGSCGVNEGKAFNDRLDPPSIASEHVTWQVHTVEARSDSATRTALTALAGTWRRADNYSEDVLTITADGHVTHANTRAGQTRTLEGTIDVLSPTHIQARLTSTTYNWGFFVDGDRVLLSNQTATGAYEIARRGVTHLGFNGQFAVVDNLNATPTCRVFGPRFEPLAATCAWEGTGDARKFILTVDAHRYIESGTNAMAYPTRFVVRRDHLIPDGDSMFWTRVRS